MCFDGLQTFALVDWSERERDTHTHTHTHTRARARARAHARTHWMEIVGGGERWRERDYVMFV